MERRSAKAVMTIVVGGIWHETNTFSPLVTDRECFDRYQLIERQRPWNNHKQVEYQTFKWVHWFNNRRLLEGLGSVPPGGLHMKRNRYTEEQIIGFLKAHESGAKVTDLVRQHGFSEHTHA